MPLQQLLSKENGFKFTTLILLALILEQLLFGIHVFFSINEPVSNVTVPEHPTQSLNLAAAQVSAPIFGDYLAKSSDTVASTSPDVVVVGIMYADNEKDSQVLIRLADGYDHIFHVGDVLPDGGVIKKIQENGILVYQNGVIVQLNLPKDELTLDSEPESLREEQFNAY